jgi:uncharacterized protein (UPF0332 family)
MNKETLTLINYRLERARESLEEAKLLFDRGHTNTYVNRLYYACFYAVSALLLTKGFSSAKHSGIRSFFHQNFVKTGRLDKSLGQIYDKLYDNRQKSDYADLINFEAHEVNDWYDEAEKIVQKIQNLINEESD